MINLYKHLPLRRKKADQSVRGLHAETILDIQLL